MSQLEFTWLSRQDLEDIGDYIAQDNPKAALTFVERLESRCALLAHNPRSGRRREELAATLRSVAEGDYVIIYRPLDDGIQVIRIVHGSRDLKKILNQL